MHAPFGMSTFEFVVVSSLRAAQLSRGCTPKIDASVKRIVMAQMEVAEGKVARLADPVIVLDA